MATSGTYTTTIRTGYQLKLVWSVDSQSVPNNTSTVTAKVQLISTGSSYTIASSATKNGTLTINGVNYSFSFSAALSGGQIKTIFTKSVIISHNADGSKTCAFKADAGINVTLSGVYYGTVSVSGSGTFNTIPRASMPTLSASSVDMGENITISTNRASSAFTHKLKYTFGNKSGTVATSVTTSASWTLPLALAEAIPNATSGTGSITCETYNGTTLIGIKSVSFIAKVPSSIVPTISSVTISEGVTDPAIATKFQGYVQNKSKLAVAITASGAYGSTISQYRTYVQAVEYLGSSFTSNVITTSGTIGVLTIVTDSRGRTAQVSNNIVIIPYTAPTISQFSVYRANSAGEADYEGSYGKISFNFVISPVNDLNDKLYTISYRLKGSEEWNSVASGNVYALNSSILSGAILNPDNAYDLALTITDYFTSITAIFDVPTAFTLIDFRSTGKGVAFGKVSEKDVMEIALDVELTKKFVQEDRKTPTLLNSWVNYGAAYESATYWKDKCGVVHLAGLIKSGTTTAETIIFTLPEGYRPRVSEKFFCVSLNAICVIDVYATGNVAIKTGANAGWLSLSGISFRAD